MDVEARTRPGQAGEPIRVEAGPAHRLRAAPIPALARLVAIAIPPAAALLAVHTYAVNVPQWDQFELPSLLPGLNARNPGWRDFVAQHNEHRLLAPRLVWVALAAMSRWNVVWEQYASVAVALITLAALTSLLRHTVGAVNVVLGRWLAVPASLLVFSLVQAGNWAWGWQLQVFLNVLGAVVAAWVLARWPGRWPAAAGAYAGGVLAMLSFGNGTLLLVLLPLALALDPRTRRMGLLAVAIPLSAGLVVAYFTGYRKPPNHPDLLEFIRRPGTYATYVLAFLGSPLGHGQVPVAVAFGTLGLASLGGAALWLGKRLPDCRAVIGPWLLLAAYAVLTAGATGVARVGFGAEQALNSRYSTLSTLLWIAVLVVGAVAGHRWHASGAWAHPRAMMIVAAASSVTTLLAVGYGVSYTLGLAEMTAHRDKLLRLEECVLHYREAPDACLGELYPSPARVRTVAARLEAARAGPFATEQALPSLSDYTIAAAPRGLEHGTIDAVGPVIGAGPRVPSDGRVLVAGWALDPLTRRPATAVLIVVGGRVIAKARVAGSRPDVAAFLRRPELARSGWSHRFGAFRVGPGRHLVEAYAVSSDGPVAARLPGGRVLEVLASGAE